MQCPAVSTQRGPIRVPPQVWWKRLPCFTCREIWRKTWKQNWYCAGTFTGESKGYSTCHGQLCGRASSPFTTRLVSGLTAGVPHPKTANTLRMQWMQCFIWSLTSATLLTQCDLEQQEGKCLHHSVSLKARSQSQLSYTSSVCTSRQTQIKLNMWTFAISIQRRF